MKLIIKNKKIISILVLSLTIMIGLSGCSRDYTKDIELLVDASHRTVQIQKGEYEISYKTIPQEGNIEFMQNERATEISLDFTRSEDDVFYEYTIVNSYEDEVTDNHFLKNEDGYFLILDEEELAVNEPDGENDYVFELLLEFLVDFTEEDVEKISKKNDSGYKKYTITFNENYLERMKEIKSSSIEEIERLYWIDDEYISKVVINYKETMEFGESKDVISSERQIEIIRTEE